MKRSGSTMDGKRPKRLKSRLAGRSSGPSIGPSAGAEPSLNGSGAGSDRCGLERLQLAPHQVLGLPAGESDPVRIITAAHVRLRLCRRLGRPVEGSDTAGLVGTLDLAETLGLAGLIIQAREVLLRRVYDRLMAFDASCRVPAAGSDDGAAARV